MARWHSCIVLQPGAQIRRLWQFNPGGGKFNLLKHESKLPSERLPAKLVGKDWQTLFNPKLNVAWLPPEKVFLRVVQLPKADAAETRSMVELQLEKLSALPVTQIVWSYEILPHVPQGWPGAELTPHATGEMQTALVTIVSRSHVEEYLGRLEGEGFLADRLELPLLDQLRAIRPKTDGVWVFPAALGDANTCLAAWYYDGVLWTVGLLHLPSDEKRRAAFQEQLAQTVWAGELEGWLTAPPKYHLVAEPELAAAWMPLFDADQHVEVAPPLAPQEMAAMTARRAAGSGAAPGLLPAEFATRYRQQFVDRLWMRALGAVILLYILGVAVYFGIAAVANWQYRRVQDQVVQLGGSYTNAVRLREKLKLLQDQMELQYAALESYKSVADFMPPELTLDSVNFERGRKVTYFGSCGSEDRQKVLEFNEALIRVQVRGLPLYAKVNAPNMQNRPGTQLLNWNFSCDLKRSESE
jgi:hypothetical protein